MADGRLADGRLEGKAALVTGGGRGIGRGIVERFLAEGARIAACGRGAAPADLPTEVQWLTADVANASAVEELRRVVGSTLGGLDILVNNAGVQIEKTVIETSDADWDRLIGANVKGVFHCCRAFIPLLAEGGGGAIVNLGSTSGFSADPGLALYNASKAFVHGLTRSIAIDHGTQGVRCNAIAPGWIMTEMAEAAFDLAADPDAAKRDALARHPVGRFGAPADIAATAVWLASDEAAFVTGQTFVVDGGLLAASPLNPALF